MIATVDTVRHEDIIRACLDSHRPLVLCGPPGSGKTMTLTAVVSRMPGFTLVPLSFSSVTTPEVLLNAFQQYCELVKSPESGTLLRPAPFYGANSWIVIFCDEINLAAGDKFGTVRVVSFLRQLIEQKGFYLGLNNPL